ncbi:LysR substrate-binding domain-containing protein [Pseudomonas aeruginosa]|uniref:LysR substrate-binding domain-containing protein n=1 Tax=Pseudomonas TaxID=286 RepID=UPI0020CEB5B8|nr:LysR substrate-binding domain-containing protein [Pseudomonas aeruginosa]MCS7845210.1 LysR substrate-binding domain-containing protein [Pseudomonas aeruginosa]
MADLADQPLIISSQSRSPSMHALMLRGFEEAGIQPRVVQQAAQLTTALGLVESGLGVATIPLRRPNMSARIFAWCR